jgi:hypothetical protein
MACKESVSLCLSHSFVCNSLVHGAVSILVRKILFSKPGGGVVSNYTEKWSCGGGWEGVGCSVGEGVVIDGNMIRGGCAVLRFHVNMCCGQLTAKLRVEKKLHNVHWAQS